MVLASRRAPVPALVVPDERAWTVLGEDPAGEGLEPVLDAGRAQRVLLPDVIAPTFAAPLREWVAELPPGVLDRAGPEALRALGEHEAEDRHEQPRGEEDRSAGEHEQDAGEDEHGGDDEDMMAITGEPSADGLVMEPIELSLGPLATPLPGGLVAEVVLDGDVVAECRLRATLQTAIATAAAAPPPAPDALAPLSWTAAIAAAAHPADGEVAPAAGRWLRLVTVELERAISHLAWLRALGRLLGWAALVERTTAALAPLLTARGAATANDAPDDVADVLGHAAIETARVQRLCEPGRRLTARTAGHGTLTTGAAAAAGLRGPAARASGLPDDARAEDPLYRVLGFTPAVREEGDALARTRVRIDEAVAAVALARAALERSGGHASTPEPVASSGGAAVVEGPRGPLHAARTAHGWRLRAPGADALLAVAGPAAVGCEWAAALVVLLSFDPSPWRLAR